MLRRSFCHAWLQDGCILHTSRLCAAAHAVPELPAPMLDVAKLVHRLKRSSLAGPFLPLAYF